MVDSVGGTHHVKIGNDHHLIRPQSYRKQPAPLFGARFTTGDPDYNTMNLWQYWVQRCWVGGMGAETWIDDAMYDEGVGVDTKQHEVMTLARDLGPASRGTWVLDNAQNIKLLRTYNGNLYCLVTSNPSKLYKYDVGTDTWSLLKSFTEQVNCWDQFRGYLVFGDAGTTMNRMDTSEVFTTFAKPSGITSVAYTMKGFRGQLYVGFGDQIWRLKSDWTWDGSTAFWDSGDTINYFNQSEIHLGFLYFASRNGHIVRTDGNNTFDLWQFDPYVTIWGIRSFDGRLFIGAAEEIEGTASAQTVIYQFSGAAVTELKRWGRVGYNTVPGKFFDYDRKLFFGGSNLLGMGTGDGFGIACYDPIEDAYHLFASNQDAVSYPPGSGGVNNQVYDIAYFRGNLWCTTGRWGVFRTPWTYKDVTRYQATYDTTAAGGSVGSKNGGWLVSSDFDAGTPGLLKLWDAIIIHVDLPTSATSVYVEYSLDGGGTWTAAGSVTGGGSGTRYAKTLPLRVAGEAVTGTRIKWRVTLRTTDTTRSPQLRGVIVRYLPIPEPNWKWDMTLVLNEHQELLDGSEVSAVDVATKLANLETAFRAQVPIHFTDIDGTQWGASGAKQALITDMRETTPYVGPSSDGVVEREVAITLLEIKDEYEVVV